MKTFECGIISGWTSRSPTGLASVVLIALAAASLTAQDQGDTPTLKKIVVRDGVELHYEERGRGTPVIFVHGSLSDGSYWHDQLAPFAEAGFRAIAYSRRYNFPNNKVVS
jgi:hypothetical protein